LPNLFLGAALFVEIKISRHAKRRAKLYDIPESLIQSVLKGKELNQGKQEIIEDPKF